MLVASSCERQSVQNADGHADHWQWLSVAPTYCVTMGCGADTSGTASVCESSSATEHIAPHSSAHARSKRASIQDSTRGMHSYKLV